MFKLKQPMRRVSVAMAIWLLRRKYALYEAGPEQALQVALHESRFQCAALFDENRRLRLRAVVERVKRCVLG